MIGIRIGKETMNSIGCVAMGSSQDGKWLGKGRCGEYVLSIMGRLLWGAAGQNNDSFRGVRGSKSIV